MPSRSTAAQSSVSTSPSSRAFCTAARIRSAWNTWGVWTANRVERSTVSTARPFSERFTVSVMGTAGAAAPVWVALWRTSSSTSGGSRGRAPSWMAMSSASSRTSLNPAWTEWMRSLPPLMTLRTLVRAKSWQMLPTSTIRSSRVTTMISAMSGHC